MTEKYRHLISAGTEQSLATVAAHYEAPLARYMMLERESVEGDGGIRIVTHVISNLPEKIPPYCDLHWHDFDEINIIVSDTKLRYRVRFEDETYEVESPCTVYVPKGIRHAAEVISGKGIFVAILFTKDYKAHQ